MDSASQSKLPVINMDDLKPGTESWDITSQKVRRSLEEYGCFIAVYGQEFLKENNKQVFDYLKILFDLPTETKMKNTSDKPFHGYVGPFHTRPLFECMGIERATSYDNVQSFANLMWPASGNETFSKTIHSYANLVSQLETMVRKMVYESYGVEKYYEADNESMTSLFKVMKYTPPKADESNLGAAVHTDKHFLSILTQNQVDGLQVQMKDDEWLTVEYLPSSFVVMATDVFMAWSNGRLRSPRHRVVMNGQEDRYSIALFSFKNGIVEAPEEFVDDENPLRFKPFDHFKFLDYFAKNRDYLDERVIASFCGV